MNENEIRTEPEKEGPETAEPSVGATLPKIPEPAPVEPAPETAESEIYEKQAEEDLLELQKIDPDAASYRHLGEMPGALRFAELRGLGLSVEEAYCAVRGAKTEKPLPDRGGRAHLHASVPGRAASGGVGMTVGEIESARRLFPGLPDREIASLWRRVNEN